MLNIDDWVWERSTHWWKELNRVYHTMYEMPQVSITDRLARKAGVCQIKNGKLEIVLYEHYIKKVGTRFDQTIGHELAHAHNWCHHHRMSHGDIWISAMEKIGLPALRCHNYDSPNDKHIICPCGSNLRIGPRQLRKLRSGYIGYYCVKCRRKLSVLNGAINLAY